MAIKVRNKLYACGDKVRYKYYRNKIYTLIRLSKRRYNDTGSRSNKLKKAFWQGIPFAIKPTKKQSGGFLVTLLANIGVPLCWRYQIVMACRVTIDKAVY